MYWVRRFTLILALFLIISFVAWLAPRVLDPTDQGPTKRARDRHWVDTSPYWWDRQACRWLSLCGLHHLRKDPASHGEDEDDDWGELKKRTASSWEDGVPQPDTKRNIHERRRVLKDVPDYVLRHAPLVHLYSREEFWPSDIKEHVEHMTAYVDYEPVNSTDPEWTLHNLQQLNREESPATLRSNDDVETRPHWLHSHRNVPNPFEDDPEDSQPPPPPPGGRGRGPENHHHEPTTWYDVDKKHPLHRIADPRPKKDFKKPRSVEQVVSRGHKPDEDGYSHAPAILVVVDKGSGIVDAFWFFFYSYNLGQSVLGVRFGNHVGDWEHCMVRFENGEPRGIFFSEHEGGQAYAWEAVEQRGERPIIYSAVGSHAMYALPGTHPYILPFGILKDVTDKGPLWDPALNNYAYHYDYTSEYDEDPDSVMDPHSLVAAASNPRAPTSWFHFHGRWGDELYSLADPRQWRLFGQYHYVGGPNGPKSKNLSRSKMCHSDSCRILYEVDPKGTWY